MLARLGRGFGLMGDVLGGLFVVGGLVNYFQMYQWITSKFAAGGRVVPSRGLDPDEVLHGDLLRKLLVEFEIERKEQMETLITLLVVGAVIFLMGRTLRRLLAGPR
jgi:hypothetical protein